MEKNFFKYLKPKDLNQNKIRVGPNEDGGYVCSEFLFEQCDTLFNYGVGNECRYEYDFVERFGKPAYLFDHTIGKESGVWKENVNFINEGLGTGEENVKHFYEHYNELNLSGEILLKIDVEGYEYEYFQQVDETMLNDLVCGLMLEVHWLDSHVNRQNFINMMKIIDKYFVLNHIHGNVWGGTWKYDGYEIPRVMELSFVNRKYVSEINEDNRQYPIDGLDWSNKRDYPDLKLNFLNEIERWENQNS